VIDELLPEVTTEALAALMQRDEEQRPVEGISWELKSEVSKDRTPRTVCAFANTLGGILILGATEREKRINGFAGLEELASGWGNIPRCTRRDL